VGGREHDRVGAAGERLAEARALLGLSELDLASGDPGQAVAFARRASEFFRSIGALIYDVRALTLLSEAYAALGETDAAVAASTEASALNMKLKGDAQVS